MMANVGRIDRGVRGAAGLVLVAVGLTTGGIWMWGIAVGAVLVLTGVVRFCPAYWLLRIRTLARPGRA